MVYYKGQTLLVQWRPVRGAVCSLPVCVCVSVADMVLALLPLACNYDPQGNFISLISSDE